LGFVKKNLTASFFGRRLETRPRDFDAGKSKTPWSGSSGQGIPAAGETRMELILEKNGQSLGA
jgi:hypothetical protein